MHLYKKRQCYICQLSCQRLQLVGLSVASGPCPRGTMRLLYLIWRCRLFYFMHLHYGLECSLPDNCNYLNESRPHSAKRARITGLQGYLWLLTFNGFLCSKKNNTVFWWSYTIDWQGCSWWSSVRTSIIRFFEWHARLPNPIGFIP